MTQAAAPGHGADGVASVQSLFPPAEVESLHLADREAARNIVCELGGLFIVGLVLYLFVCIWTG
jgi:hypothetical protein